MVSPVVILDKQRHQTREDSKQLTRPFKNSFQQLAVPIRREQLAKDRGRRIGLLILAIAAAATTFLVSDLKSELPSESEPVADSE